MLGVAKEVFGELDIQDAKVAVIGADLDLEIVIKDFAGFHYHTHDELKSHLANFVDAYNFARRLKTLKGRTPYEFIAKEWTKKPERFRLNPSTKCRD